MYLQFVHGGPFANIAHGCNSVISYKDGSEAWLITQLQRLASALTLALRNSLTSNAVWLALNQTQLLVVATVRALKYNGGVAKADLNNENLEALEKGLPNLLKHVNNITECLQASMCSCNQCIPNRYQGRA